MQTDWANGNPRLGKRQRRGAKTTVPGTQLEFQLQLLDDKILPNLIASMPKETNDLSCYDAVFRVCCTLFSFSSYAWISFNVCATVKSQTHRVGNVRR